MLDIDAAGHLGNLETARVHQTGCCDRNSRAEHKRQMVLGQLAAHGVADTRAKECEYHLDPAAAEQKRKCTAGEGSRQTEHQWRIQSVHLLDFVKVGVQLLAGHTGADVGKLSDELLESVEL